jgi:hypothetical protein
MSESSDGKYQRSYALIVTAYITERDADIRMYSSERF